MTPTPDRSSQSPTHRAPPDAAGTLTDTAVLALLARSFPDVGPLAVGPLDDDAGEESETLGVERVTCVRTRRTVAYLKTDRRGDARERFERERSVLTLAERIDLERGEDRSRDARSSRTSGVRLPRVLAFGEADGRARLLLEPLGTRLPAPTECDRPTTSELLGTLVRAISIWHARWRPSVGAHSLPPTLASTLSRWGTGTANAADPHARRLARLGRRIPSFLERLRTTGLAIDPSLPAILELVHTRHREDIETLTAMAPTILHGDLHPGNARRLPDRSIGLIDWQHATLGTPMLDVQRLAAEHAPDPSLADDLLAIQERTLRAHGWPDLDLARMQTSRAAAWRVVLAGVIVGYGGRATITPSARSLLARCASAGGPVALVLRDL